MTVLAGWCKKVMMDETSLQLTNLLLPRVILLLTNMCSYAQCVELEAILDVDFFLFCATRSGSNNFTYQHSLQLRAAVYNHCRISIESSVACNR